MKLHLPTQQAPNANSSPSNPRQLKKVLSALPVANMGELTKQTFQILRDQNRQLMPAKHRLENLKMLRKQTRNIFNNLKKYFINRTLPLPAKSQKIFNLNQSILRELIIGYEIIVYEAATNNGTKIEDEALSMATYQSINYLAETFLRASDIYAPCPQNLWLELHQLYVFAKSKKLTNTIITNAEHENATIESSYKQILLFALTRPATLRQSDIERTFQKLYQWSQYTSIHHDFPENLVDHAFHIRITEDSAPDLPNKDELTDETKTLILNADKLISHVKNIISQQNEEKQKVITGAAIPVTTLQALINAWTKNTKRRFIRVEHLSQINATIGLVIAAKAIRSSLQKNKKREVKPSLIQTSASIKQDPDFTLQSITTDTDEHSQGYLTHAETGNTTNNAWDMVAKGRVLTETYEVEKKHTSEGQIKLKQPNDEHWHIVNFSAGGYCLRWDSDDTSKAQIGELIALQEFDVKNNFQWRIGIIRWMQFTHNKGLEIGIQIISPKVVMATAQRHRRQDEASIYGLILPGIQAIKQPSTILLPAHTFKTNDKLVVKLLDNKLNITQLNITLDSTVEHTGSFTQFTYKSTDEDRHLRKKAKETEATTQNQDDFDELWSSL